MLLRSNSQIGIGLWLRRISFLLRVRRASLYQGQSTICSFSSCVGGLRLSTGKQLGLLCLTVIGSAFRQQGLKRTLRFALRLSLYNIIGGVHHTNFCSLDGGGRKANWEERNLAFSLFCVRFCLTEINNSCCPLQRLQPRLYVQGGSASCKSLFLLVFAAPVCS